MPSPEECAKIAGQMAGLPEAHKRDPAQVLATYRANLLMARDVTALKLASLRSGSSAYKTTAGMLRAFNEALDLLASEMGAMP